MFSMRKVVLVFVVALLATSLAAATSPDGQPLDQLQGMRMHRRRADAGRQLRARDSDMNSKLKEMYDEFVAKAQREHREPASFEDFKKKYPKAVKRALGQDDDGSSKSSSSSSTSSPTSTSSSSAKSSTSSSASASSTGSSSGSSHKGQATYYTPGMGACGKKSSSSDMIVALSHEMFDKFSNGNPNSNELCGKKIKATYQGKSTTLTVVDRCTGCSAHDLDMSPTAFSKLASKSKGRLHGLSWSFVN